MEPYRKIDFLDEIWAKSPSKGESGKPESLVQHTWYVLERLADFINLRPGLPKACGQPNLWHVLYWSAFLHDFGKVMPAFQGVLRGDVLSKEKWSAHRHEVFSLAFVEWIGEGINNEERDYMVCNIVSHHRDADDIGTLYPDILDEDEMDPLADQFEGLPAEHLTALHHWLSQFGWQWAVQLGLDSLEVKPLIFSQQLPSVLQNINNIRKALCSYQKIVRVLQRKSDHKTCVPFILMRGTLINADHSASAHAKKLPKADFKAQVILDYINMDKNALYLHQCQASETIGSTILTAPTGSGKTEAALLWAANQSVHSEDGLPRLFYALPYQASMNTMNLRLEKIFGDENVGLQHGRSLLALYRMLLEKVDNQEQASQQAKWMRNLIKLNYPPVRVFSPYQMLKSMYRLKGYEAILADYYGAAFIFDEIHAYEVRRLAMIFGMIAYLRKNFQARFLVMSATLPSLIKRWLVEALDSPVEICAGAQLYSQFQRHRLDLIEGEILDEQNMTRITADAVAGKSVLVVCNLVARAQEVFEQLKSRLKNSQIDIELLHSRFNMRDRSAKENVIRKAAGSNSAQRKSMVLVSTQVVEVSLDIDLETIYSEPAPLEALVQRFGRVNRRRMQSHLAPVHVFSQPDDGQFIYDPNLISAAMTILNRESGKPLDENVITYWLDEIYRGDIADTWQKEYDRARKEFESICIQTLKPFQSDKLLEDDFYKAFDGIEILPATLYDEYQLFRIEDPILANELLVPISWGRYMALVKEGRVFPRDKKMPPVVMGTYGSDLGLTFDEPLDDLE